MKIGVFGDSFADRVDRINNRPDESWMQCLENIGHEVVSYGLAATSTYYSYKQFLKNYHKFENIIFCYSSLDRIHAMPKELETFSNMRSPDDLYASKRHLTVSLEQERILNRILTGYMISYDLEFNVFIQQKIFDDVNNLCRKHNKHLINILPFEEYNNTERCLNYENRHGVCLYNLLKVTEKECGLIPFRDRRFCHMSLENNQIFANIIMEQYENNSNYMIDLLKDKRFLYTSEIYERYRNPQIL